MNKRQLEADADFSRRFQGYCLKTVHTLEALPMRAYTLLSAAIFLVGEQREERWICVGNSKMALHDLAQVARKIETWIECIGGPKAKLYVSKLSDEEIAKRIAGEYSEQRTNPPNKVTLSKALRSRLDLELPAADEAVKKHFISSAEEAINDYLHDLWRGGKPNNREDHDKLETLRNQVNHVIAEFDTLIPMAIQRYPGHLSEWGFEDDFKNACAATWNLYHGCLDAIEKLNKYHGKKKPLETQLADDLAYCYWRSFDIKPSHDPRAGRFMAVLSIIEEAIGERHCGTRILGEDLVKSVIADISLVIGQNKKNTDTPEDKK